MSARRRPTATTVATATATATAAVAAICGALALPAAAHAATPSGPLTLAVSDVTHNKVTRGHGEDSFTLTVTNTSDAVRDFGGELYLLPAGGPSPLDVGQVSTQVTPLNAPATDVSVMGQAPGLITSFSPHGTKAFQVPAGSSYRWKVSVAFAAGFPGNDDGLDVHVSDFFSSAQAPSDVHFDVSPPLPDGRITEKFGHAVTVASGTRSGRTTLEVDNGAGGEFTSSLFTRIEVSPQMPGLALEYLRGGVWVEAQTVVAGGSWRLPDIPAGFAHGQKRTYDLRFTVTDSPDTARDLRLTSTTLLGSPIADAQTALHVEAKAATPAPSTPAPTATAAPVVPVSDATTSPAAASSASSSSSSSSSGGTSNASGQLAHTGSSGTGLVAGTAAVLAAAGAATIAVGRRRARRRSG
jgi:hypothetical protein